VCLAVAVYLFLSRTSQGGVFFLVLAIIAGVGALAKSGETQLALTDSRIMGQIGWLRKDSIDVPLRKIDGVRIEQSLLGGLLNYGTIYVGNSTHSVKFEYIARPMEFRNDVSKHLKQLS
jgi:uncharacterized membrane protein YdbT with pleckstrin-like domain